LTPGGRVIWHRGIAPDVPVGLAQTATPLTPEAEKAMTPTQWRDAHDEQLQRALDLLTPPGQGQTSAK